MKEQLLNEGYYVGKITEIVDNVEELNYFSDMLIKMSADKSKYYTYRHNVDQGFLGLESTLELWQISERKKFVEDNNLTVFQQWYESSKASGDILPSLHFFRNLASEIAFKNYSELNRTNIHHVESFTIFENGDFIKQHSDGANEGRLCVVLIYISPAELYNNGGGKLIIHKNQTHETVDPIRGNYVMLDFTKNNISHSVEVVKNNFSRFCYIDFVYNKDNKTNELKY